MTYTFAFNFYYRQNNIFSTLLAQSHSGSKSKKYEQKYLNNSFRYKKQYDVKFYNKKTFDQKLSLEKFFFKKTTPAPKNEINLSYSFVCLF